MRCASFPELSSMFVELELSFLIPVNALRLICARATANGNIHQKKNKSRKNQTRRLDAWPPGPARPPGRPAARPAARPSDRSATRQPGRPVARPPGRSVARPPGRRPAARPLGRPTAHPPGSPAARSSGSPAARLHGRQAVVRPPAPRPPSHCYTTFFTISRQ